MQIRISWLLQKPTDLDLHCLQRQYISGFSMTRVNIAFKAGLTVCFGGEKKKNINTYQMKNGESEGVSG